MRAKLITIVLGTLVGACALTAVLTLALTSNDDGHIVVKSVNPRVGGRGVIVVRAVSREQGLKVWLFGFPPQFYRCEYYRTAGEPLWSSQSLSEESYRAQRLEVVWQSVDDATVFFDGRGLLTCRGGLWVHETGSRL